MFPDFLSFKLINIPLLGCEITTVEYYAPSLCHVNCVAAFETPLVCKALANI
jgi:hypothetical protein